LRNLFDQYTQPENRLSHALAVCLDEDRGLLGDFINWIGPTRTIKADSLHVIEQSLPGEVSSSEQEAERRGLPDIIIHDDDSWCVLIESKINAPLTDDQLNRHRRTLERRGFNDITILALTKANARAAKGIRRATWSDVYKWLGNNVPTSAWGRRLREYLRIAEVRLAQEGYLTEGTLTMFDGFRFAEGEATFGEAKRLLKLAMGELRQHQVLIDMGIDPKAKGRGAIKTSAQPIVWDLLPLKSKHRDFTKFPHLTLDVTDTHACPAIVVPNGAERGVKKRLSGLTVDSLCEINKKILTNGKSLIEKGVTFHAYVLQRHFLQRRYVNRDGNVRFRLETSQPGGGRNVKYQPEWCELLVGLARHRRSNLQFAIQAELNYEIPEMQTSKAVDLIAKSWYAMRPFLNCIQYE